VYLNFYRIFFKGESEILEYLPDNAFKITKISDNTVFPIEFSIKFEKFSKKFDYTFVLVHGLINKASNHATVYTIDDSNEASKINLVDETVNQKFLLKFI
jgi:hypothetical protein